MLPNRISERRSTLCVCNTVLWALSASVVHAGCCGLQGWTATACHGQLKSRSILTGVDAVAV
jgi:hypothetical protein